MQLGSLFDSQVKEKVIYSYHHRGLNTLYLPDDIQEAEEHTYYTKENGNLFFERPVSWKNTGLLQGGVDIRVCLAEKCFIDHIFLEQSDESRIVNVEIFTLLDMKMKKIGAYLPETGKMIASKKLSVPVGWYCDNIVIRLNADCMPITLTKLDVLGAWDMENAVWPTPYKSVYHKDVCSIKNLKSIKVSDEHEKFAAEYLCEKLKEKTGYAPVISEVEGDIVFHITEKESKKIDTFELKIEKAGCLLQAPHRRGLLYAVDAMLQCIESDFLRCCHIEDEAFMEIRGIHVALPDKAQIPFLKKLIKYVLVPMRYNTIYVEIASALRYDNFPEINEAWLNAIEKYEKGEWPKPPHYGYVGRDIWEKSEVQELCKYMESYGIEVVPEVQSFSHSQYITMAYPDLAEKIAIKKSDGDTDLNEEDALPSKFYPPSLCPSHPDYYKIIFGIMDEVIEAFKPKRFLHIGHDELWDLGKCSKCSKIPRADIFAEEVTKVNEYVKSKNLKTIMWSDMLQPRSHCVPNAINKIPKDIIMMDFVWYFFLDKEPEVKLLEHGFDVIMGNMYSSHYPRFEARAHRKGILGAEVSAWVSCDELTYSYEGKLFDFVYSSECMWNSNYRSDMRLSCNERIKPILKDIRHHIGELHSNGLERSVSICDKRENIPFDIRDIVPYSGAYLVNADQTTAEIMVRDYAEIISFVHATDRSSERVMWAKPFKIGRYIICYEDGTEYTEDILYAANIYKYLAPFGDRITSPLFRHEGYVGTYLTMPECGKTYNGQDYTLGRYSIKNPYPNKKITSIILEHSGNTDAEILLFDVTVCISKR
ncbi:MAG: family 20 glycosylhydrolase [Lachnospiraceae bacterium]|nr:family 20 glycosylhydrolase [Lachnospiraceae bacterium]